MSIDCSHNQMNAFHKLVEHLGEIDVVRLIGMSSLYVITVSNVLM